MGITISYEIKFKGTEEELLKSLQAIRQKCMDLPFEEVEDISCKSYGHREYETYKRMESYAAYPNNSIENLQKLKDTYESIGIDRDVLIHYDVFYKKKHFRPFSLMRWGVWADSGCEYTSFSFIKKKVWWETKGFTKTQFAEHFLRSHSLIIRLLEMFKEQGFVVKVRDEGGYWGKKDIKELSKNINSSTEMIKSIFQMLTEDNSLTVDSPITRCENYIEVKDE